ncbi:hypothetical protein BT96DRAFT_991800 [Gymnopus androsaceus JB14]|uniref:Uncharacterized protein n=1 Tax=Gymnopus androsaceus JB14 TaxID=1447944 RepID=A0A6A4HUD8_9AGAR|nr:hypothetical protein BT96DRAFT_991800 [Gymnopus androsaceus JB14]
MTLYAPSYAPFGSWPADCVIPAVLRKRSLTYANPAGLARELEIMESTGELLRQSHWKALRLLTSNGNRDCYALRSCHRPSFDLERGANELRDLTYLFSRKAGGIKPPTSCVAPRLYSDSVTLEPPQA